jgi:hypothetical protein
MIATEIRVDPRDVAAATAGLRSIGAKLVTAQQRALNLAVAKAKTMARPQLMEATGLASRKVSQRTFARKGSAKKESKYYLKAKLWFGMRAPVRWKARALPSKPFFVDVGSASGQSDLFVRVPGATRRTADRPATSPGNLPIVRVEDWPKYGQRAALVQVVTGILKSAGERAMLKHYQAELRRQIQLEIGRQDKRAAARR